MYYSAPYLHEFYNRIKREAEKITSNYEIVFVNDGSPDQSLDVALTLYKTDARVRVIDLSRNFGHHKAIMTGLMNVAGNLVFLIDCDLEEEPELLSLFHDKLCASAGTDVVFGVQGTRKGSWFEKLSGNIFYTVYNALSSAPIPKNLVVARLMTKRYVDALIKHQEREMIISGLWQNTGFTQTAVTINKHGKAISTYNIGKRINFVIKAIISFSSRPLIYISYLGAVISGISLLFILYYLYRYIFTARPPEGYTSIMVSLWFLGGLIILSIGIVAIYISVIFTEVKQRPYTTIRQNYDHQEP